MDSRVGLVAAASAARMPERSAAAGVDRGWTVREVAVDGPEWRQLLDAHRHMLFHEPDWARVTQRGFAGEATAVVFEREGAVRGGALGFAFRSLWAKFLYFSFPYGGVVGDAPGPQVLGGLLEKVGARLGVTRVRVTDCPGMAPVAVEGFDRVDMQTHVLDLSCGDYETLWTGFKARVRRDVRKAERSGVTVTRATSLEDVATFYELYLQSMRRNATVAKYRAELVEAIHQELGADDRSAFLLARRAGEAIAGVLIVDSEDMSHYLMGGSSSDALQYCPNDLLLHSAIRRAVEKGKTAFDFLPSGVGDEALERFKAKWGSVPQPISVHSAVVQPFRMALWDAAYRVADNRVASAFLRVVRRRGN